MQKYYKYQYRFNAVHSFDYIKEHEHQHTFTITLYVSRSDQDENIVFSEIDRIVIDYLSRFEHTVLNEQPEFRELVPNIENIGDVFFEELQDLLISTDVKLYQLDVAENPLSTYEVSNRLHIPVDYQDT